MTRLHDLRDMLRRENERASHKISKIAEGTYNGDMGRYDPLRRLHGKYGVDISGTEYDPRPSDERIGRMTTRQAEVALDRLREFTNSGNVGYYAGNDGAIISRQAMLEITYQTRRYNREIREYRESVKDVLVPWAGDNITAGEYYEYFVPKGRFLEEQAHFSMNERRMPVPTRYTSDESAWTIANDLKDSMHPTEHANRVSSARNQVQQMVDVIGDPSLESKVGKLNDAQFWFMWTLDSTLADQFSIMYEHNKNIDSANKSASYKMMMSSAASVAERKLGVMLRDGATLPIT